MSLVRVTRVLRSGVGAVGWRVQSLAWKLWHASIAVHKAANAGATNLHASALRRVRSKARAAHIAEAQDYSRLQEMHSNIERQLSVVRGAAMRKLLDTGNKTSAVEQAVNQELTSLGYSD